MGGSYVPALATAQVLNLSQGILTSTRQSPSSSSRAHVTTLYLKPHVYCSHHEVKVGRFLDRLMSTKGTRLFRGRSSTVAVRATVVPTPDPTSSVADATVASSDKREEEKEHGADATRRGLLVLASVPLVWGTYAPSVKYMYEMGDDLGPPGLLFNFACYLVSALALAGAAWVNSVRVLDDGPKSGAVAPRTSRLVSLQAARAGLELGGWLFLGSTAQVWGLEITTASRAAFLVQLTTVIVPVLEAVAGQRKLKAQVWFACLLATVGVTLVSLGDTLPADKGIFESVTGAKLTHSSVYRRWEGFDMGVIAWTFGVLFCRWSLLSTVRIGGPAGLMDSMASEHIKGDLLVAASAVFYSLHVVRLGVHVASVETLTLARAKALAELGYASVVLSVAAVLGGQGENFARFATAIFSNPSALMVFGGVAIWNGAMTTAYAMWAQTRGQAVVAPSEANLVYSMQPLWSTFFAVLFLKEAFGALETTGAVLMLTSVALAAYSDKKVVHMEEEEEEETWDPHDTRIQ